jgi:hypothetical protein
MKQIRPLVRWSALALLSLLLASCGALNAFIPNQEVGDLFGLDGQQVTMTKLAGVQAQAVTDTYRGSLSSSTDDLDATGIPDWVSPSGFAQLLGAEPRLSFSSPDPLAAWPLEVTLTSASFDISVSDGSGQSFTKSFAASDLNVVFTQATCAPGSCEYTVNIPMVTLMALELTAQDLQVLYRDILTNGVTPNAVSAEMSVSLQSDAGLPSISSVTLTIKTEGGTLTF